MSKITLWVLVICLGSCLAKENAAIRPSVNPAAQGFDVEGSDARAIAIADEVMENMGGRAAWDNVESIEWTFFGRRKHIWNRAEQYSKISLPTENQNVELNLIDQSGSGSIDGVPLEGDSLQMLLTAAEGWWINDSYWLVMPFKLKDSGVTLKYVGRDSTESGLIGDKLSLTFEGVGRTPQNKYEVIVTDDNRLIEEWRFYTNATDSVARFSTPWTDYKKYGDILLSGDRGRYQLTDIKVKMKSSVESE